MASFYLPDEPATWVFAGDSITQGLYHTHGERCWVEHVHERVRQQLDRLTDVVINSGVSGWRSPDMVSAFDRFVGRYEPQVVSIAFGANDALAAADGLPVFRAGMDELVRRSRDLGAQVVVHTPNLVTVGAGVRAESIADYVDVVRAVASDFDLPLVDHAAHWDAHFGELEPIAWLDDHTHPNAAGHLAMANLTLRTLGLGELDDD